MVEREHDLAVATITISLRVENAYSRYEDEERVFVDVVMPAPPTLDEDDEEYAEWAYRNIYEPYTGVGHTDGDSWYDVEVTACSMPELVWRTFDWGY